MKQAVLAQFNLPWIPITGLVLFVVCFALYCYWTFRRDAVPTYQAAAQLPLVDPPVNSSYKGTDRETV